MSYGKTATKLPPINDTYNTNARDDSIVNIMDPLGMQAANANVQ